MGLMKKGGYSDKLIGAAKSAARIANNPIVQFGVGLTAPEVGAALGLAKSSGLLKKVARM